MVQTLTVSGTTNYTIGANPKAIAPNLNITDPNNGNLNGASVIITSNFNPSEDRLAIAGQTGTSGTIENLNWNYNTTTGVLSFTGTATNDVYQNVLRQVTYNNTNNAPLAAARGIAFDLGTNLANPENNHFYEFVPAQGISWGDAQQQAATRNYFGLQGYLTTITSGAEQNFIQGKVQGNGWLGGSDATTEGDWRWLTGPEAGTAFWSGNATGSAANNQYNNWLSGEPNNLNNQENYVHVIGNPNLGQSTQGKWNDLANVVEPGDFVPQGYLVEYGGLQGDPTLQITGNVTVTLNATLNAANNASRFDFTGDGRPDILWRNYSTDETAVWQLNGTTFQQSILFPPTQDTRWEIEGQGDFTGDGKAEILWRNYSTAETAIWQLNGTTLQQPTLLTPVPDTAWRIEGVSDFTGDGNADILWRNNRTGENGIWQMNGTTLQQSTLLTTLEDTAWQIKGVADFTGDGKDEILWRNNRTGENAIWQLNGTTVQEPISLTPLAVDTGWDVAGEADFTGDGKVDILWRNNLTGENAVWQMNGTTFQQSISLTPLADTAWQIKGLGDFTDDGKVDILWRNGSGNGTDETAIWRLNGTNLEEPILLPKTGSTAWEVNFPSSFAVAT